MIGSKEKFEVYGEYKDSGVEWIGEIPKHWELLRNKFLFREKNIRSSTGKEELLSLSKYHGLVPRTVITNKLESATTLVGYKICNKGDLVINKLQAWNGMLDIAKYEGLISPDYSIYVRITKFDNRYFKYLFRTKTYISEFTKNSKGIGEGFFRLYKHQFYNISSIVPPLSTQKSIANFLDHKTQQIDNFIELKEKTIALLEERKAAIINQAVTKGLDAGVEMKDSGIEWLGEIPKHWEVKKLKYVLRERTDKSETGLETLLMMSQKHGLVVRADYHEKAVVAETSVGNKRVFINDLVFNKLKAHLGVFFKSTFDGVGLVSPDYAVYYSNGIIQDVKFLELLFRHPVYISHFICNATGIVEGLIRLYTGDLYNIEIPIPPKEEQVSILKSINKKAKSISKAIAQAKKEITLIKEYRQSLISAAVTGKIKI